jgi:hypothetical protein
MRILALFIAVVVGSCVAAGAADDVAAARSVIKAQEQAFSRDDAAEAYTFAAPGLKSYFRTPETFMYMVRNGYAPVYRHRAFEFGETKIVDGKIYQVVQIIDEAGEAWDAQYTLEQQDDGTFKISACILKKAVIS